MTIYQHLVNWVETCKKELGIEVIRSHSFCSKLLNADSIVIDVGAKVGEFSTEISQQFGCQCYAIEAVPEFYAQIPQTPLIKAFNYAVSSNNQPLSIYLSEHPDCSSIYSTSTYVKDSQKVLTVEGITLETFLQNQGIESVDLLKVDIEGAERELFQATCDQTLSTIKQITIEFHDFVAGNISREDVKAIEARLVEIGFFRLPFSYLFPKADRADILFVNQKLCPFSNRDLLNLHRVNLLLQTERTKSHFIELLNSKN